MRAASFMGGRCQDGGVEEGMRRSEHRCGV